MLDFSLNSKNNENDEKYFSYLFNKIEFDHLKVKKDFYKLITKRDKSNKDEKESNDIINPIINRILLKLKLNKANKKTYSEFKILNNKIKSVSNKNIIKFILQNSSKKIDLKNENSNSPLPKFKRNAKKRKTQVYQKYLHILSGTLDKELYLEKEKNKEMENIKKLEEKKNLNKNIENKKKNKIDKLKIIDSIYLGKSVINNCVLRNKIIYDIKPLNQSNQKGKCCFQNEEKSNINENYDSYTSRNIFNSINHSNNGNNNLFRLNSSNDNIKNLKKQIIIEDSKQNEKIKLSKNNKNANKNKLKKLKEIVGEIPLNKLLSKDISEFTLPNMKTFYGKEYGSMIRGEKIKFLKTCYPVKFIKPILTQKGYIVKPDTISKKVINHKKKKKFSANHYNLDIMKKENINEIKRTKEEMKVIKRNIIHAFDWIEEQKKYLNFKTEII